MAVRPKPSATRLPSGNSCTSILCHTTSVTPARPATTPAHCVRDSRSPIQRQAITAVASVWSAMISLPGRDISASEVGP